MKEWLPQITVHTSTDELLERPSAFNPYPELADNSLQITENGRVPTLEDNFHHYVRYGNGDVYRVQWPAFVPVGPNFTAIKERPGGSPDVSWDSYDAANLVPFRDFWETESVSLVRDYLCEQGRRGAEATYRQASKHGLFDKPPAFVRFAAAEFDRHIQNGDAGAAYVIAQTALTGTVDAGKEKLRCLNLYDWLDRQIVRHVEPGVSNIVRDVMYEPVPLKDYLGYLRMQRAITRVASSLVTNLWTNKALQIADEQYKDTNPAIAEKVVLHQIREGSSAIQAVQEFAEVIKNVPMEVRGSNTFEPAAYNPGQIGAYILSIMRG